MRQKELGTKMLSPGFEPRILSLLKIRLTNLATRALQVVTPSSKNPIYVTSCTCIMSENSRAMPCVPTEAPDTSCRGTELIGCASRLGAART